MKIEIHGERVLSILVDCNKITVMGAFEGVFYSQSEAMRFISTNLSRVGMGKRALVVLVKEEKSREDLIRFLQEHLI